MLIKEIGNIKATIDVQKTAAYYERLSFPQIENSSGANFAANLQLRSAGIRHYLSAFGVDYRKYQDLDVMQIDPYLQTVDYIGTYKIFGTIPAEQSVLFNDADYVPERESTAFGFDFYCERKGKELILNFVASLPWVFEPPIEISRYVNEVKIPDLHRPIAL